MAICSDMERVFEIGPIFRAEKSFTHRHLCEFVGLDMEMAFNEHYHEVLDMLDGMFIHIFDNLAARWPKELSIVNQQFPFAPLEYLKPSLRYIPSSSSSSYRLSFHSISFMLCSIYIYIKIYIYIYMSIFISPLLD